MTRNRFTSVIHLFISTLFISTLLLISPLPLMSEEPNQDNQDKVRDIINKNKTAAERGDAAAQYFLAYCYEFGQGVEENQELAKMWFIKALENEHPEAMATQAMRLEDSGDHKNAFIYMEKAANKNLMEAQYYLAFYYIGGTGVNKSIFEARNWLKKAAMQGHVSSQYSLGNMYLNGHDVKKDLDKAIKWLMLAADQGDVQAQFELGLAYVHKTTDKHVYGKDALEQAHNWFSGDRDLFIPNTTEEQKLFNEANKWFEKASYDNHISAQFMHASLLAARNEIKTAYAWSFIVSQNHVNDQKDLMEKEAFKQARHLMKKLKSEMTDKEFKQAMQQVLEIKRNIIIDTN